MGLELDFRVTHDPTGHGEALLLRGDWVFVLVSDGEHTGVGEATHSGDDAACVKKLGRLFEGLVRDAPLDPGAIRGLEGGAFARADDFLAATAISALDQALWDLVARREGVPVWRLFTERPARRELELYATVNRALTDRAHEDYRRVVSLARAQGFGHFKCAPFERVARASPRAEQLGEAADGLGVLRMLRKEFGELSMRIDFHERFSAEAFLEILPEVDALGPRWIEEPCESGPACAAIRRAASAPLAAGELHFGAPEFERIIDSGWADVVMPDVKHVGGFGPLVEVCRLAERRGAEVSPHNPSGPVSTAASAHAAAVSAAVRSLEFPLDAAGSRAGYGEPIEGGMIRITDDPGWGMEARALGRRLS